MGEKKKYYQHVKELKLDRSSIQRGDSTGTDHQHDVLALLDGSVKGLASRRSFLKLAGFSTVLSAVLSSCEKPLHKAIPYLIQPEDIIPGKSTHYASSFFDGEEFCSLLVKSRDGRPIKIEGNPLCSVTRGGTSARIQASVLGLYDNDRHHAPLADGKEISWETADVDIVSRLKTIRTEGGNIILLTPTIISPTAENIIREFLMAFPGARHVTYDTVACSGILLAHERLFGVRAIPQFRFDRADLIVSFDADFLGTWISPVEFTAQYASVRKLDNNKGSMARHVQFEPGMSLTGSNADVRYPIKPSEEKALLIRLLEVINGRDQGGSAGAQEYIAELAGDLNRCRSKSLVVSGSADTEIQLVVCQINHALGNYGSTLDLSRPVYLRKGIDSEMITLVDSMNRGEVNALLLVNTNPVYHYPVPEQFEAGMKKCSLTVSLSVSPDETSTLCRYVCPSNHYLESWGDAQPVHDRYALQQPLINPVFKTRQWEETLLRWSGNASGMQEYLKGYWENNLFPRQHEKTRFYDFWVTCLQKGVFEPEPDVKPHPPLKETISISYPEKKEGTEIHLYQSVALGTGRHANNPWLQELPDPVSKVVWENYAALSPRFAAENSLTDFDVIEISGRIALPVLIQPGQAYGTISIALGYGRRHTGKVADGLGANAFHLATVDGGLIRYSGGPITLTRRTERHTVARSQIFSDLEGRPIVRETTLADYLKDPEAGNKIHKEIEKKHVSLYADPKYDGFHWGLSVDLNSCTGCGACIIACQAENNIPVVGKAEVSKFRIMHWIRVDRYYTGDPGQPDVVHQPVMCMHCDHAPCENVCPVSATPHNNEGLNQVA